VPLREHARVPHRTVLIVDDHTGFRAVARMMLETDGWRVVGEADGVQSGIAASARLRPEVVLVDVNLPDGDGFAVAQALRARPSPPHVVLISSRDDAGYAGMARGSGADGFIPKAELSCGAIDALIP
jgi:DNA-binding NarL/FixJ family response regulator